MTSGPALSGIIFNSWKFQKSVKTGRQMHISTHQKCCFNTRNCFRMLYYKYTFVWQYMHSMECTIWDYMSYIGLFLPLTKIFLLIGGNDFWGWSTFPVRRTADILEPILCTDRDSRHIDGGELDVSSITFKYHGTPS